MDRMVRSGFILAVAVIVFSAAGLAADLTSQPTLLDQGWRVTDQAGQRVVELRAQVLEADATAAHHALRFVVESRQAPQSVTESAETESWQALSTVPGDDSGVATLPYALLTPGRLYRFRAELVDTVSGAVIGQTPVTRDSGLLSAASVPVAPTGGNVDLDRELRDLALKGTGEMEGVHTAQRVGNNWVESGSGDITITSPNGRLLLHYTYTAQGASAASLTATATATGTFTLKNKKQSFAVTISNATAQITAAGHRRQRGTVIRRTGSKATGTFTGTVGTLPVSGLLTLTDGSQTLDLGTNTGKHEFTIQFTRS